MSDATEIVCKLVLSEPGSKEESSYRAAICARLLRALNRGGAAAMCERISEIVRIAAWAGANRDDAAAEA